MDAPKIAPIHKPVCLIPITRHHMRMSALICALFVSFIASSPAMLLKIPNTWIGIPFTDRWGGCYFFTGGLGICDISEKVKDKISDYGNTRVSLNVTKIYFANNPGDVRVDEFIFDSPETNVADNSNGDELRVVAISGLTNIKGIAVKLQVTNLTDQPMNLTTYSFRLIVLAKKPENPSPTFIFSSVSDGPSYSLNNGWTLYTHDSPSQLGHPFGESACSDQHISWRVSKCEPPTRTELSDNVELAPNQTLEITVDFIFSKGEYEILFGYDGRWKRMIPLLTNGISVNAFDDGHCEVIKSKVTFPKIKGREISELSTQKAAAFTQLSEEDAVKILKTTTPFPSPLLQDDKTRYDRQLEALIVLTKSQNQSSFSSDLVNTLIPYLGYTTSRNEAVFMHMRRYSVDQIEKIWPAFTVIMEMPNSGKALEAYCTNKDNSVKNRLMAFTVLSYKDAKLFSEMAEAFTLDLASASPVAHAFIMTIRNHTAGFWGDSPVPEK